MYPRLGLCRLINTYHACTRGYSSKGPTYYVYKNIGTPTTYPQLHSSTPPAIES